MTFINVGFVIPEGETEIECVYVEERVRSESSHKKGKWLEDKAVVCLRSKGVSCVGTGSSWPTVSAVEHSSSFQCSAMPAIVLPNLCRSGDGGIDICGNMYGISFGAQWPAIVRELRGALALISNWVLGVIVIPSKRIYLNSKWVNGYLHNAYDTANKLGIVLTDLNDIYLDIKRADISKIHLAFNIYKAIEDDCNDTLNYQIKYKIGLHLLSGASCKEEIDKGYKKIVEAESLGLSDIKTPYDLNRFLGMIKLCYDFKEK
ncbi:17087_t:CDS:2 [Gigaspora margarita]|uniref:17087_t:CDS:1 n=1 Tax=Gigaspora margarita TaxID=4874 RepID=A0ABM8VZP6_GIGMA|nr:17087_t:CDS:2 [Gigaspora margarita]